MGHEETVTWPDGGITPFRGEKGTTWEGGMRVPMVVRWPGVIKPGTVINDIFSQEDWMPTLLAAAGVPDVKEKLAQGYAANSRTFRVHADGTIWQKVREFLVTIPQYPFQEAAGMNPADLNYMTLKAAQALKQVETLTNPNN